MEGFEYTKVKIGDIPKEFIKEYDLSPKVN